jgi:hypothetical protein
VRLEEADRREERLGRVAGEEVDSLRRDELDVRPADAPDVVVAEHVDIVGDVLLADQLHMSFAANTPFGVVPRANVRRRCSR